jgi:hypothetical protein
MVDLRPRRDHDSGKPMSIVEKTYLLNGEPVVVLAERRHVRVPKGVKAPPRNLLILRAAECGCEVSFKLSELIAASMTCAILEDD